MKTWLRLSLVTLTVGGGFLLIVGMFEALKSSASWSSPATLALVCLLAVSAIFITVSGLLFVNDSRCIRPMQFAIALQIPWFSSTWFTYKLVYGISLLVSIGAATPKGNIPGLLISSNATYLCVQPALGASFDANLNPSLWGVGINLIPVLLLFLIRSQRRESYNLDRAKRMVQPHVFSASRL